MTPQQPLTHATILHNVDYTVTKGGIEFFNTRTGSTIKRAKLKPGETWIECYRRSFTPKPFASLRKVGGIWHWRIWRLGGSLYFAKGQ